MALACKLFGHKWAGCICSRCGEIRNEEHQYALSCSKDSIMCSGCGKMVKLSDRFSSGNINLLTSKGRAYYFAVFLDTNDKLQYTRPDIPSSLFAPGYQGPSDISNSEPHVEALIGGWPKLDMIIVGRQDIIGIDNAGTTWHTSFTCSNQRLFREKYQPKSHPKRIKKIVPHIHGKWILYDDGTVSGSVKYIRLQHLLLTVQNWSDIVDLTGDSFYCAGVTKQGKVQYVGDNSVGKDKVIEWDGIRLIEDWDYGNMMTSIIGLRRDGTLIITGKNKEKLPEIQDVDQISTFDEFAHVLKSDGTLLRLSSDYNVSEIGKDYIAVSKDLALKKTGYLDVIAKKSHGDLIGVREWKVF